MSQSLAQIYLHVVFSTKGRRAFLSDRNVREQLHAYFSGACRNLDSASLAIGGVEDHVHILCRQSRNQSVAELVRDLKRESSKWIKLQGSTFRDFQWQGGYGAFSVSPAHVAPLRRYIANQQAHHRKETFQDEFRRLLKKYNLEYDERYVWN